MSILLKDNPVVPFADKEIEIKELTIKKLKKAKKDLVKIGQKFLNELSNLENAETENEDEIVEMLDKVLDIALDIPYDVIKIFVPEIKKNQVEEATPREIINLLNEALDVNGFFMMKDKLGKMFQMMR